MASRSGLAAREEFVGFVQKLFGFRDKFPTGNCHLAGLDGRRLHAGETLEYRLQNLTTGHRLERLFRHERAPFAIQAGAQSVSQPLAPDAWSLPVIRK